MKRAWLWLTAGFLLFSVSGGLARPTQAQLDSLEALQPALDEVADFIRYDSLGLLRDGTAPIGGIPLITNNVNYWIGVRFKPETTFTLHAVFFQVDNSLISTSEGCSLYVVNDATGYPDWPSGIRESLFVPAPLPNRLRSSALKDSIEFSIGQNFWVLLGPVPGGLDNGNIGDGWWALRDTARHISERQRSYISLDNRTSWGQSWSQQPIGNWILRAGGEYSPGPEVVINEVMFNADPFSSDSSRNHEWIELFNHGKVQTTNGWQFRRDFSDPSPISIPNGIGFPSNTYLVVHVSDTNLVDTSFGDGRGDIYVKRTSTFFNDRVGQCILFVPDALPINVDVVNWNLNNLSLVPDSINTPGPNDLIRVQPESALGPLLTATSGVSFGRDSSGCDRDSCRTGKLVDFLGGPDAAGPTMGRKNALPMVIDVSTIDSTPVASAVWTLMLYFAADNGVGTNALERWCYDILNQIEDTIPTSTGEVNVAVWFDSRSVYPSDNVSNRGTVFQGTLRRDRTDMVKNLLPVGELNSGDSTTLKDFIRWAISRFPASRYALALKGDGAGWEGICGDATSQDRIEMGELKSALSGGLGTDSLDLLILDAPLMSQLEVATQVKDFAHFMVSSPEMTGPADFDYARLVGKLNDQPAISDSDLAVFAVDAVLHERLRQDLFSVWAAIRLDGLNSLLTWVDTLAHHSEAGVKDACGSGVSGGDDNYQLRIRSFLRRISTDHYGIQAQGMADFVDLKRLAQSLKEPVPSACTQGQHNKGAVEVENFLIPGGPIIAALGGGGTELGGYHYGVGPAGGLSIYFPSARQKDIPIAPKGFRLRPYTPLSDHPFDSAGLETEGGVSQVRRIYAADLTACYPHAGGTCSTSDSSDARNHPFQPVADFDFVRDYHWDEFLIRYYKPVADAGPGIPVDRQLNEVFSLDAYGTSDPDDSLTTLSYYWDIFVTDDPSTLCSDYRLDDLDKDCVNNGNDDADSSSQIISLKYTTSGTHWVWLHVWDPTDDNLDDSLRRFQTSKDSVEVQIQFRGIHLVYEDAAVRTIYTGSFPDVPSTKQLNATSVSTRNGLPEDTFIVYVPSATTGEPHVIWATGSASPPLFPSACQKAINKSLAHGEMGFLIFGPGVAGDPEAKRYFDSLGFAIDPAPGQLANFIVPDSTYPRHFLFELGSLPLSPPGVQLRALEAANLDSCVFPILKTDAGKIVAAAKVTDSGKHAIVYFTFDLGWIENDSHKAALLALALGWLASPVPPQNVPVCCVKGEVNQDGVLSAADVVKAINCIFTGPNDCRLCATDVNCSGDLSGADVVILLQMAFNNANDECP